MSAYGRSAGWGQHGPAGETGRTGPVLPPAYGDASWRYDHLVPLCARPRHRALAAGVSRLGGSQPHCSASRRATVRKPALPIEESGVFCERAELR